MKEKTHRASKKTIDKWILQIQKWLNESDDSHESQTSVFFIFQVS